MALPDPKPGLVIHYSYLWSHEFDAGHEEGSKDRPVVIVVAVEGESPRTRFVTVVPITHAPPPDPSSGIELPARVKEHLGLDDAPSWVIINEANRSAWPGHDLRPIPGTRPRRHHYGFLPPRLFDRILDESLRR